MTTTPAPSLPEPRAPHDAPRRRWPAVAALLAAAHGAHADAPAVVGSDGVRTVRELAAAATAVAVRVRHDHPDPATHIGIPLGSRTGFVAAVLGCMQAGVTFSVLAPGSRVDPRFLGVSAVLDGDEWPGAAAPSAVLSATPSAGDDAPTGEDWTVAQFGIGADDRIALWSGVAGQVISTISTAVCTRAALVITPPPLGDAAALATVLRDERITVLVTTTPILRRAAARSPAASWPGLRLAVVDHEAQLLTADAGTLRRVAPAALLACTYRTDRFGVPLAAHLHDGSRGGGSAMVPVGTPPPGSALAILTSTGRPAGVGEIGEICAGSARTGDLARRRPDGTVELVGHVDVERERDRAAALAALMELPGVVDAVILDHPAADGSSIWTGYLAGPVATLEPSEARRSLAMRLPHRLIPEHLVVLDALPMTSAGRHDLDALPEVDPDGVLVDTYVAPRTPLEQELCAVLQGLLGVERVGIDDSFFELGGFSLLATQLTTRMRESYGVALTLREVFDTPTVGGLAHLVVRKQIEPAGDADLDALLAEIENAADGEQATP